MPKRESDWSGSRVDEAIKEYKDLKEQLTLNNLNISDLQKTSGFKRLIELQHDFIDLMFGTDDLEKRIGAARIMRIRTEVSPEYLMTIEQRRNSVLYSLLYDDWHYKYESFLSATSALK